jgi:hypothetical protein
METTIINSADYWIHDLRFAGVQPDRRMVHWEGADRLVIAMTKVEPSYSDTIEITLGGPIYDQGPVKFHRETYTYDTYLLQKEDLLFLSSVQLRTLRNLIFAIHGYKFRSPDLREYFGSQEWYSPSDAFSDSDLTDIERRNIALIQELEAQRK